MTKQIRGPGFRVRHRVSSSSDGRSGNEGAFSRLSNPRNGNMLNAVDKSRRTVVYK